MPNRAASALIAMAVVQAQVPDAASILAGARQALGGDARIGAVKTFVITGRTRQVQGDNLVPIEFEIACELPDKCIRRDEIPARESGPTTIGFNGDELIQLPVPPPVPARGGAPPPGARLATVKQDFARLFLGMFAAPPQGFALTFARAGEAEAPQGRADVLEVKGPGTFTGRFFVFQNTHLPVMFSWQAPSPAGQAENRLFYADYRDVDGLMLPFRLRRAVGADTVEETTIDRIRINTKIDPRRFEVRR